MWSWSLTWGEITPSLVVGTCPMQPRDLERIHAEARVSAVLSLQHSDCHAYWDIDIAGLMATARELGLTYAHRPIRDFDIEDMRRHLPSAVASLAQIQAAGKRTYVHCTAGLGRAPLTILGFLTLIEGWHPDDAIQLILRARPDAVPAWEAYYGCIEDLVARHRSRIERRAYDLHERNVHANPEQNWLQAQSEVFREVLVPPATDGHRSAREY